MHFSKMHFSKMLYGERGRRALLPTRQESSPAAAAVPRALVRCRELRAGARHEQVVFLRSTKSSSWNFKIWQHLAGLLQFLLKFHTKFADFFGTNFLLFNQHFCYFKIIGKLATFLLTKSTTLSRYKGSNLRAASDSVFPSSAVELAPRSVAKVRKSFRAWQNLQHE